MTLDLLSTGTMQSLAMGEEGISGEGAGDASRPDATSTISTTTTTSTMDTLEMDERARSTAAKSGRPVTWETRRVRLVASKPSLAQTPSKRSTGGAIREVSHTATATATAEVAVKPEPRPPVSAPAVLRRSPRASTSHSEPIGASAAEPRPVAVLDYCAPVQTSTATTTAKSDADMDALFVSKSDSSSGSGGLTRSASTSSLFSLNDGRPGLWSRRNSLVTKKSGEIVKPSLKVTRGTIRGTKPRSNSEPATPTKFVHFDAQICRVRFFRKVESPHSVASTESEGEDTETSEDDDGEEVEDEDASTSDLLSEDEDMSLPPTARTTNGLRSCGVRIRLPNFPAESLLNFTKRPVSVDWIRIAEDASHVRILVSCQNLSFQKTVLIRYSLDEWRSMDDMCAEYCPSENRNDGFDRFLARLPFRTAARERQARESGRLAVIEFCVRYIVDSKEFWDNNHGRNYRVVVDKLARRSRRQNGLTAQFSEEELAAVTAAHEASGDLPVGSEDKHPDAEDYFSLATAPVQPRPQQTSPTMGETTAEQQAVQRDAEKAWRSVLASAATSEPPTDASTATSEVMGRSPDHAHWTFPHRKPIKSGASLASRYDFGASLKAAARSGQRRPLRRVERPGLAKASEASDTAPAVEAESAVPRHPTKKQIGFAVTDNESTALPAAIQSVVPSPTVPEQDANGKMSALSRAINVSPQLASSTLLHPPAASMSSTSSSSASSTAPPSPSVAHTAATVLHSPVLPWLRTRSFSTAAAAAATAASTVSAAFSAVPSAGRYASSPSMLFLDEGLCQYANTAACLTTSATASALGISPNFSCYSVHNSAGSWTHPPSILTAFDAPPTSTAATNAAAESDASPRTSTFRRPRYPHPHRTGSGSTIGSNSRTASPVGARDYSSPFSESPLSSPSTTPMPWIRG